MEGHKAKVEMPVSKSQPSSTNPKGTLRWVLDHVEVAESAGTCVVEVERVGGSEGEVSCEYKSKDQSAVAEKDYIAVSGQLTWADGDSSVKKVEITVIDDDDFEKDEEFTIVLSEVKGGAEFDSSTDGGRNSAICTVVILNDDDASTKLNEAIRLLRFDSDVLDLVSSNWTQQLKDSLRPGSPGAKAMAMHVFTCPWKVLCAVVPPPGLCNGWPCFVVALLVIAFQVILISDFASQMGCEMFIAPSVTAITFVALGTSLPDTFASMQAARGDKTADNSIGNVTGSNSVNVFFGLGIPWLIAAIYWAGAGATSHEQLLIADC